MTDLPGDEPANTTIPLTVAAQHTRSIVIAVLWAFTLGACLTMCAMTAHRKGSLIHIETRPCASAPAG